MTGTVAHFDVRALIRQVCQSSDANDPERIAKEVSRLIEDHQLRDAVEQLLPSATQNALSHVRRTPHPVCPARPARRDSAAPVAKGAAWKRDGVRRFAVELRQRYATGPRDWKPLGLFTIADCALAAELRERHAAGNLRAAERMRTFAELMTQHRVTRIEQLTDEVLAEVFGDAR